MKITNSTIKKLLDHYKEISLLYKIKATLDWDMNVNLPSKAATERAKQTEYLAQKITDLWIDNEFKQTLEKAQKEKNLTLEEQAILRNLIQGTKYYFRVPPEIIAEKEKLTSEAFMIWKEAKEKNDFKSFLPSLKELIRIDQIIAKHIGYKDNPYDALLDQYEPGLTADHVQKLFDKIKPQLVALVQRIQKKQPSQEIIQELLQQIYPIQQQKKIGEIAIKKMGFDFEAGRVDVSPHPFTTELNRNDIRFTTAFIEKDFRSSYTAYMHEAGHALYEQGINPEYDGTPLEGGVSLGIHEALSRFWENMIGKNPNFLKHMKPFFQENYLQQIQALNEDEFINLFYVVKPSFIRIESDEVTYTLHIILRFEMENGLINGTIKPEDAATVWKEKSKEYFGIVPPTDTQGVLQDVHWAYGSFGYFPSYALGNLYGAQFLATMKKEFDVEKELTEGSLAKIHAFLKDEIHEYGSLYLPAELIKKVTGEPLNPHYFLDYLTEKYTKLYS
ncbi:MAG TPA: carboxypeptidase M32 [Patescibacteria group bacterium]|nr:carboxypeptidase M32 [Patescibacteria group bacterium]